MNRIPFDRTAKLLAALTLALASTVTFADGADEAIPSFYQEPGLSKNRGYINQHANEKIDPFTGKLQWHFTDLFIPGNGGMDLKVQRSYSSLNEILGDSSPVGAGWTMHFGRVIRNAAVAICDFQNQDARKNRVMELSDGSRHILYYRDAASAISPGLWLAKCSTAPEGGLDVTSPDGTVYQFSTPGPVIGTSSATHQATWYVKRITDRNGNFIQVNYTNLPGGNFGPQSVSTSDGRSLTYTYSGGKLEGISDGARTWTYGFEAIAGQSNHYFLTEARRPDGTSWRYEYNPTASGPGQGTPGGFSMKKVTYPTGGVIDYTYSFLTINAVSLPISTVISRKDVGSDSWTYTYTPATTQIPFANGVYNFTVDPVGANPQFDKTLVDGPEGTHRYFHVGYASVTPGSVFLIGSLAGKVSSTRVNGDLQITEIESYSFEPAFLSSQGNVRPGNTLIFDAETHTPRMTSKTISRAGRFFTTSYSNFDAYNNAQTITETGTDSRVTNVTYLVYPVKWILHTRKDETVSTIPGAITRTFDGNANLLEENRYGVNTIYTYTGAGDVATKKDARENLVTFSDYYRGIPRAEAHPESANITRTVSPVGDVLSETDGEGHTTSYAYDGLSRLTGITHGVGNPIAIDWFPNRRELTRGGYKEIVTFDGFGRETQVQHTGGSQTITQTHQYDAIGRKVFSSYPNSAIGTGYALNIIGQPVNITHEHNPQSGAYSSARSFIYFENKTRIVNERGKEFVYTYREFGDPSGGQLMAITAPVASASITMERNGLGQLTQVTQDGKTRGYGYDSRYFMTSMTDPEVGTTTYGRDAVGNMTSRKVGASGTTNFSYDGRNRLTTTSYPSPTPEATRTYYRDDKLKTAASGIALREYFYDASKNLTQEKLTITGQPPFVVDYGHDGNDALTSMAYSTGQTVTYAPDAFGRPTQAAPFVDAITHHPGGQIASLSYANGATTTIGLNSRQWPATQSINNGQALFATTYLYDDLGNIYSISDSVDASYNRGLNYDDIDRVTGVSGSWANGSISYDGRGNITQQVLGPRTFNYAYDGGNNRLISISGAKAYSFSYDVYGNVSGNGSNTFAYNDAANMRCANCGLSSEILYDYDAGNMRVKSTKGGAATYFMYGQGGQLLWEKTSAGAIKEYIYVGGKQVAIRNRN